MPHADLFLRAFDLTVGKEIGGYKITDALANESVVQRWQVYGYLVQLTFQPTQGANYELFGRTLQHYLAANRWAATPSGHVYQCSIPWPPDVAALPNGGVILSFKGARAIHTARANADGPIVT